MYSPNIINRFTNPKNAGYLKNADGVGMAGNPNSNGDIVKMFLKVENEKIIEAKFKALGCVVAIACADVVIDLILNKTIDNASKISTRDIVAELGEMDENKRSCQLVAIEALHQTIEDYKEKQERERLKQENGGVMPKKKARKSKK